MAAADLTTTAAVKAYAGVTGSGDDVPIGVLVSAVSALLHGMVGHDYGGDELTDERHSGPVSGGIVLEKPAASIQAIRVGGTLLDSSGYELDGERMIWRKSGEETIAWASGRRNVEVDYTTTSTVPDDLELAARETCAFMVKQTGWTAGAARLGLSAQANADTGSADYFAQAIRQLPMTAATLRRYQRLA